ncbi:hypothetical protein Rt10032_c21g6501 [Rhodotorula toruloides]|uniref:Uncharacterized protein n=1 Tax=Rhodotorula toruloides TaxID=5286 RepID=A0A511KSH8_RHOTO|nr:hypothetical protein Rt10032_c21g6501 [Rhodotorula toruloides]
MAHLAAHPTPADDLPLFARGSPPAQLRTVPFLDSNAPFPALSSVEVDADLLVRAMGAHCFLQWVIKRAEDFSQPIGTLWHRWAPQMWDFTNTTIRRLTSDVFSARGVMEISKVSFRSLAFRVEVSTWLTLDVVRASAPRFFPSPTRTTDKNRQAFRTL